NTAQKLHLGFKQNVGMLAGEKNADIADKGWVSFPCVEDGRVVSIKYRSIVRKAFCKQGGMATALFNTETIDLFEPVYLVEGEPDACVLEQAGFHAVSLQSASTHPAPEQKDQLMRAGMVILAGDNDGGVGEGIMQKLWRELQERTYLLKWPPGIKDANQFFLETCKRDVSIFQTKVEELTLAAKSHPMADVYSIQEVMQSSQQWNLTECGNRFRFTQPAVDKMAILLPGSVLGIYATNTGMGKALAHGTKVMTPSGPVNIEDIKVGDMVSGRDGRPTKVIAVYPQGEKRVHRITFTDDTTVDCCEDHLWAVRSSGMKCQGKPFRVFSVKQLLAL